MARAGEPAGNDSGISPYASLAGAERNERGECGGEATSGGGRGARRLNGDGGALMASAAERNSCSSAGRGDAYDAVTVCVMCRCHTGMYVYINKMINYMNCCLKQLNDKTNHFLLLVQQLANCLHNFDL